MKMKLIILFAFIIGANSQLHLRQVKKNITNAILQEFNKKNMEKVQSFVQILFTHNVCDFINKFLEKNECTTQLYLLCENLRRKEEWAVKMIDATAKFPSGILTGNVMNIGNYDECINIHEKVNDSHINGKYCTVRYSFHNSNVTTLLPEVDTEDINIDLLKKMKISYGICIPEICSASTLQSMVNFLTQSVNFPVRVHFDERFCDTSEKYELPFSSRQIIALSIFGTIGALIILSTLYDVLVFQKNDKKSELLIAFSLYTNGKAVFSTKSSYSSVRCLNGLRVLSMAWIVLGHRYLYLLYLPMINFTDVIEWTSRMDMMFVIGATYAVDTFFVISGLLVMYIFLKNRSLNVSNSIHKFILHRFLRLVPPLAMVILFTTSLFEYTGAGPLWMSEQYFVNHCRKNWWVTLLFIQNFLNPTEMCLTQSWYLAVDTQLYLLSPLILYSMVRWPKKTIAAILAIAVGSCVLNFQITWSHNLSASFLVTSEITRTYLYYPTYLRVTPWLFGLICGYVVFQLKDKTVKLNKMLVCAMWIFLLSIMIGLNISIRNFIDDDAVVSLWESAVFNAITRPLWSLAICLIIFACVTGNGGIINTFLSCSVFNVLIRFNYNMYLLHLIVITYFLGQKHVPEYIDNKVTLHEFWGDLVYTLLLAIVWTLAFESPIVVLERVLFKTKTTKVVLNGHEGYRNRHLSHMVITENGNGIVIK